MRSISFIMCTLVPSREFTRREFFAKLMYRIISSLVHLRHLRHLRHA